MVLLNPYQQQKWNASIFKICPHADYMNSNNLLETISKDTSYEAVCNCHSVPGSSTHSQWPVTPPPDPTGVLHFLGLVVMLLLNWTAIPNVCCPPCNISNEKWNCWLFTIISSFEWVLPAKYRLGFYTQWCVRAGFLRVKYDVGTALLTTYLFSSSTAFC